MLGTNFSYQSFLFFRKKFNEYWFWLFRKTFDISKSTIRNQKKVRCFFATVFWYHIYSWKPFYPLNNANSVYVIFHVEKTFNALVCQMCRKYTKTKSEIMKHYQKASNFGWFWVVDFEILTLCQKSQNQHKLTVIQINQTLW